MAFKAVEEPKLMQANNDVMTRDVNTARMGTFEPVVTFNE